MTIQARYDAPLRGALAAVMEHRPLEGVALFPGDDPVERAMRGLLLALAQEFEQAYELALAARAEATSFDGLALARGVLAFASAGWPLEPDAAIADPIDEALADLDRLASDGGDRTLRTLAGHMLLEGACAQYRLHDAARLLDATGLPDPAFLAGPDGAPHVYLDLIQTTYTRVLVWSGRTDAALAHLGSLPPSASLAGQVILAACHAVASGHAAEPDVMRGFAAQLADTFPEPVDHVSSGFHLMAGYGLAAVGETARAARSVITAGGDADLPRLTLIDRAMSLELLVAAALAEDDHDAAESWIERQAPLTASPIARATVWRTQARMALHRLDLGAALDLATRARDESERCQRPIEVADTEVLLSRIEIAMDRGAAAHGRLARLVDDAELGGHAATRLAANRELRRIGRRLPPPRAQGWDVLSERERAIALAVAQGQSNPAIAASLHLSPHTVRIHVSRVLAAFGVPTRTLLAVQLADRLPQVELPALTPRQLDVARLVAEGARNADISEALGIGVRTVEQHVAAVMARWQAGSRAAIAGLMAAHANL
ncbi:helix-turn-helix transcriptional regulator [Nocardioides cavernaquae]|uniref:LuxR family transcriptional regulator n=1 Tax=Nocardioides cavernaquae TaxID=2321396 RepID=A0A3A5HHP0_9ACTN|nr:helix-turn-helix transcriptional regulator [Nocardioides cavernaquae]RJS47207.1 LuxR family transcriptional regulator [Nocardioides cavernaquae]